MICPHELQGVTVAPWVVRAQLGIAACALCIGCGSGFTAQDGIQVGVEIEQQRECVDRFAPDASAQDACRAQVRATWDAYWATHFDGGKP